MNNFGLLGFPRTKSISDYKPATPSSLSAGITQVLAGEAVKQNDLLQMEAIFGKSYRVRVTDNAAVPTVTYGTAQTNSATGQIIAQTTVVASQTSAYNRQAVLQNAADGCIYTLTDNTASAGLMLNRYSSAGTLIGSVVIDAATTYINPCLLQLSNGNIAVISSNTTGTNLKYAVYDTSLNVVSALATIDAQYSSNYYFGATALSAGGFAIVYQPSSNDLLSKLVTYDNTGAAVVATTTIWTRTGTTGVQCHKIAQLSTGNLAVAISSNNSSGSTGLYHGIVTVGGASVLAFANLNTTANNVTPDLSVMSSYYGVSWANGSNQLGFVFNNSGALQGSGFSGSTTISTIAKSRLVNDGSKFWLLWSRSSDSKMVLTKLPTTGTGYVTSVVTLGTTQYSFYMDAFCENGCIIAMSMAGTGTTAPTIWVISTANGTLISTSGTTFGSAPSGSTGTYGRIISGGDGAFICVYDYSSSVATNLCVGKYVNTAIIGVTSTAVAAGALATLASSAGPYITNPIAGSPSKAFDMTATTQLYGNKGSVLNNGAILKGM
ncbi:MAG: hypothetical protein ACXV8Q_04945 [Methylobacter sp.]